MPSELLASRALQILLMLSVIASAGWGVFALWFQLPLPALARSLTLVAWSVLGFAALADIHSWSETADRHMLWLALYAVSLLCLLAWWHTLKPSHARQWADDVSRLLVPEVSGSHVTLHNVRNFDWRGKDDYTVQWDTREYNLERLVTADLILSYWMGPMIAHTLVSFGFDDGGRVVFSLEIRKERGEAFSAIGGFFRRFESVIVAADERDIIRVRSNARGEDVYLYRLSIPPAQLRTLFLGYVEKAQALQDAPQFYNTLTSNCTTIAFELARRISPRLPLDYRLLLSGYFAQYAYDHGGLVPGHDFARLKARGRITQRAREAGSAPGFSQAIRRGIPGIKQYELIVPQATEPE